MSYRRRHRWFPRLALALAVASVMFVGRTSLAAAKVDEGTSSAQQIHVIPYLSHGILTQADADVAAAAAQPQKPRLNPYISLWMKRDYSAFQHAQQTPYMSLGMNTYGESREPQSRSSTTRSTFRCGPTTSPTASPTRTSRRRSSRPTATTGGSSGTMHCRSASASSSSESPSAWRSAICAGPGSQASSSPGGNAGSGLRGARFRVQSNPYGIVTPLIVTGLWIV